MPPNIYQFRLFEVDWPVLQDQLALSWADDSLDEKSKKSLVKKIKSNFPHIQGQPEPTDSHVPAGSRVWGTLGSRWFSSCGGKEQEQAGRRYAPTKTQLQHKQTLCLELNTQSSEV